ncbi:MAG: hypothetical protein JOS17DRAFT_207568 [Linnemannia elongata]|nr:MAG: hypothetical protein JOS17DRAFT_207568 [Linnemannia elongata]
MIKVAVVVVHSFFSYSFPSPRTHPMPAILWFESNTLPSTTFFVIFTFPPPFYFSFLFLFFPHLSPNLVRHHHHSHTLYSLVLTPILAPHYTFLVLPFKKQ